MNDAMGSAIKVSVAIAVPTVSFLLYSRFKAYQIKQAYRRGLTDIPTLTDEQITRLLRDMGYSSTFYFEPGYGG